MSSRFLGRLCSPPAWPQANNLISGAAAICGVEARSPQDDEAEPGPHVSRPRRSPPQEPPEDKRLPGAEGPPEGKLATPYFQAQPGFINHHAPGAALRPTDSTLSVSACE